MNNKKHTAITLSIENYNWIFDKTQEWMNKIKKETGKRKKISANRLIAELIKLAKKHPLPMPIK